MGKGISEGRTSTFETFFNCCSGGSEDKASACNAGDTRDMGLIPGLGRSPGVDNGNLLYILAWKIPWTEEPIMF